jgi:hypothetical protein
MPEPKEDVKQSEESSATEQEVVNNEGEQTTPVEETTTQETTEQTQDAGQTPKQDFSPVDEKGVPWMNRFYESERKSKELIDNLESKIGEILTKQSTPAQPQEYTVSQLEEYALKNPEYRPWVEEQKAELIAKKSAKLAQNEIKVVEDKRMADIKRQQSYNYVSQQYPDCFTRDNFGNQTWNNSNPMVQQIGLIMQDKRFAQDPEGLVAAADMAYGRLARMQSSQTQKKVKTLQQNLKKVQKGTMIEGGGQQAVKAVKDDFARAKETLYTRIQR